MKTENSVAWLLNLVGKFQPQDLQKGNLKDISESYMQKILQYPQLLTGQAFTYNGITQDFQEQIFYIYPNILITSNEGYHSHLILSNCTITKELVQYKEAKSYGLIISNDIGNTYIFFSQFLQFRNWYKQMKQYCKLSDFFGKYKLTDRMLPGVYQCFKKSNNNPYTVQIYKMDDFEQCPEIEEVVHNEIQLLRSVKHQNLLQLRRVYEDDAYLFIVYDNFKGESLFNLVGNSVQPLHEVQIASIIYQVLQVLKFLEKHQFYHGNLNPLNVIINSNNQLLQIFLMNLSFKVFNLNKQQYKLNEKLDWIMNRQIEGFNAPEFYNGIPPNIQSDLYSLGVLMYFMAFPEQLPNERNFDRFELDTNKISKSLNQKLVINNGDCSPLTKQIDKNTSLSQLDLMSRLLDTNPKTRIALTDSMKHHWFINIKSKIKQLNVPPNKKLRKMELPSLRTIIELRSQSELDLKIQSQLSMKHRKLTLLKQDDWDSVPDEGHVPKLVQKLDFCQLLRSSTQLRKMHSNKSNT